MYKSTQPNRRLNMTYIIEASTFGIGYSVFRLEHTAGKNVKRYITHVDSVEEG